MNTLRAALAPGLIAGILSIFTSFLWMGGVFHRFQRETPETWRPENSRSYALSSLFHILSAFGIACLFVLVMRFGLGIFAGGFFGSVLFAICLWGAIALPIIVESALFIKLHPLVTVGRLLDTLCTSLLACVVTWWWLR
jgi:hypothetical protein